MKKKMIAGSLLTMLCLTVGTVFGAEADDSQIVSVKVNCTVLSQGQNLDSIEVQVKDGELLNGLKDTDFSLQGKAYGWSSEKEYGFKTADTHDFTADISGITVDGDTLTLSISDFNEKYYYVDSYTVTCNSNEALTFTQDQVTEVVTPVADDFEQLTESFDEGPDLVYNLYTPDDTSEPLPLVLVFHGSGDQENTRANRVVTTWAGPDWQEKHPSYVLAPVASDQSAEALAVYVDQAVSIVNEMIENGQVDPDRVYVTGKSMGGGNTVHAAAKYSDLFAAALPLCPSASRFENDDLTVLADMPIWFLQGTNDQSVPIEGTREAYQTILEAGSYKVRLREFSYEEMAARGIADEKHHDVEIVCLEDDKYMEWLFAQRKSDVNDMIDYIKVNTSVPAKGQRVDTIELFLNGEAPAELKAEDFTFTGAAYTWAGNAQTGYRSDDTHDFQATISDVEVADGKVTLTVGEFPEKYFYVDSYSVTCAADSGLDFSMNDVRETNIAVVDDFTSYYKKNDAAFDYHLYAPKTNGEAVPLVLALHGSGDQMNLQANRVAEAWADPANQEVRKAFVLAPIFYDQSEEAAEEIYSQSVQLIRQLIDLGLVDRNRVYVTGKSMGGINTGRIYAEYNGMFAAAMPLCGGFHDEIADKIENLRNKPIWILQGDGDSASLLDGSRNFYAALQEIGNDQAKYFEYTVEEMDQAGIGYHDIEILAMEDERFMEWMFAQTLS